MFIELPWLIFALVACLLVGLLIGSYRRASNEANTWSDGYDYGYRAASEIERTLENLPPPEFVGEE